MNTRLLSLISLISVFGWSLTFCLPASAAHDAVLERTLALPQTSLVLAVEGTLRLAHHPDRPMIPASTMKLVTALAALERWGRDWRFVTELYRTADGWLWVVGRGDPYLISEEWAEIAAALAATGERRFAGVGVDDRLFADGDALPGRTLTANPYDAPVTALAANFNTIKVRVDTAGVASAEPQTPLTATAVRRARTLPPGEHRVNLATREQALSHCAELLAAQLREAGVAVAVKTQMARLPADARLLYRHTNRHDLAHVLTAMLRYSNNFIANSLFLALGETQGVASVAQAQEFMTQWARARFGWEDFRIADGAGLSRDNRLSARQLLAVLDALAPYRELLPVQSDDPRVRAKTGTLTGVSGYAGYVRWGSRWEPFVFLSEDPIAPDWRGQVASALAALADES